ncbi:hypothetical protein Dxin01_01033 [Deinococcus xinjiangensis]|uniref:Uncharacterized protein n=1 Tax=Deinococcus xinjiangensis TaxID=457454 RepID=A0ABP9V7V0_9DEIO
MKAASGLSDGCHIWTAGMGQWNVDRGTWKKMEWDVVFYPSPPVGEGSCRRQGDGGGDGENSAAVKMACLPLTTSHFLLRLIAES